MPKKSFANSVWQFSWSKWIIYLTAFFAPLYASTSHWYPFTTPKTLIIIGGTLLADIFFCFGLIKNKEETLKFTSLHFVLLAFLFIMSLAGVLGIDPQASFFGTFFSSVGIVLLLVLGLFACLVAEFTRRDFNFVKHIMTATFFSGVMVALVSYMPLLGFKSTLLTLSRGGSMVGNSSFAGAFLLFAISFGGYLTLTAKGWKKKTLHVFGILAILACPIFFNADFWRGVVSPSDIIRSPLLLSGEAQGAELGVVVFVFATISLWLAISRKKIFRIIGISFFILFTVGVTVGYVKLLDPTSEVHRYFAEAKSGNRFLFWNISEQAIAEKPLLGYGFETYQRIYQQRFDPIVFSKGYAGEQWVTNPHNIVYDVTVSSGLAGLLSYMALLGFASFVFFYFAKKSEIGEERWMIIFPGILLGYFVQNFFIFDTPTSFLAYFICIGVAMGCLARVKPKENNLTAQPPLIRKSLSFSAIGIFAICFVFFVILPAHESKQWAKLQSLPVSDERTELQERVRKISLMGSVDDDILYARATLDTLDSARAGLKPDERETFLRELDSLVGILEKYNKKHPDNFYVPYTAGMMMHIGLIVDPTRGASYLDQARAYFEQARLISPLNPRIYFNLAQNVLFRKDKKSAVGFIKAGITLGLKDEGQEFLKRIQK